MKILALDTALGACSVAVLAGKQVLAHRWTEMERGHAEALAPMVEAVVKESGIAFADFDRLAVTIGPGTFTGQRVGLAFARGLRVALKHPLIGLTTLEVIAVAASFESGIARAAVLHDAKRGEVYLQIAESGTCLTVPVLLTFEEAIAAIANYMEVPIVLAGTAAPQAADYMYAKNISVPVSAVRQPDALWVARLAAHAAAPDIIPAPLYLRVPDAKLPAQA